MKTLWFNTNEHAGASLTVKLTGADTIQLPISCNHYKGISDSCCGNFLAAYQSIIVKNLLAKFKPSRFLGLNIFYAKLLH